jgi:hypothetical protein
VDPDGKVAILIPLLPAVGSIILKGAAIAGAIIGGIVVGEAIKDGIENENQESSSVQQAEKSKQSIESNAQSVTPNLEPLPPIVKMIKMMVTHPLKIVKKQQKSLIRTQKILKEI